jgi:large subunit ribosomal protein L4
VSSVNILNSTGGPSGEVTLDDSIFGAKVSVPLMHQVVLAQLAAARAGTHKTKTRAEVRGGGAKPWRQKGTGRARHGSTREPQWKGGGVVFGPVPRDHSQHVPKKMKAAALRSALSQRVKEGKLVVAEMPASEKPRTKDAIAALQAWNVADKVLVVLTADERNVAYSFRNLPQVHLLPDDQLNVYDIMNADTLVLSRAALDAVQARLGPSDG